MESDKINIYIQSNQKQLLGAKLSAYSLLKNCSAPRRLNINIMQVENFPLINDNAGRKYLRKGKIFEWDNKDLQSFTLTRFLPPSLQKYFGRALVIDPDVFATSQCDIIQLFEKTPKDKAIYCSQRKSSVMLLDCEKLKHWDMAKNINDLFLLKRDYRDWMSLKLEDEKSFGELGQEWNDCDRLTEQTQLIHFTRRLTQPWKTGLKVDFSYDDQGGFIKRSIRKILKRKNAEIFYEKNSNEGQITFFFNLVRNALKDNAISFSDLEMNVSKGYVRQDFMNFL